VPVPINLDTVNSIFNLSLQTPLEVERFLASQAEPVKSVRTSEDAVVSKVGRRLYELMFRNYTRKQWGLDPSELDASVTARIPVRTNCDDRYFSDRFQAMPADGYTRLF
jgi:UDP-galactopyranose mutase